MPLPRRQWVAKFTPDTLETYLSDPDPLGRLRQEHTVWSDDFDNVIDSALPDDAPGLSRTQLCRLRDNQAVFSHRGHPYDSTSLLRGFRPSHLLFTDDCFIDGLVEGVGIILVIVSMLAASVALSVLIRRRISFWRAGRRHCSNRPSRPVRVFNGVHEKFEALTSVEAV